MPGRDFDPEVKIGAKHEQAYYKDLALFHFEQSGRVWIRARGRYVEVALAILDEIEKENNNGQTNTKDKFDGSDIISIDVFLEKKKKEVE